MTPNSSGAFTIPGIYVNNHMLLSCVCATEYIDIRINGRSNSYFGWAFNMGTNTAVTSEITIQYAYCSR